MRWALSRSETHVPTRFTVRRGAVATQARKHVVGFFSRGDAGRTLDSPSGRLYVLWRIVYFSAVRGELFAPWSGCLMQHRGITMADKELEKEMKAIAKDLMDYTNKQLAAMEKSLIAYIDKKASGK